MSKELKQMRQLSSTHGFILGDIAKCGKAELYRNGTGEWQSNGYRCSTNWLLLLNPETTFWRIQ
jgi:predicted RNA-binding Zn-ribbon protein involved in translation (DUF1610 family)